MIEIKHRYTLAVLFRDEDATTIAEALTKAVKAGAYLAGADLARADLARADLAGADLARAYLAGADLAGAYLAGANLTDAYLAGADLAGAYLAGAYLAGADLADAYLAGANLAGAYLARADLAGAYLAGAYLAGAYLAGADLADAYLADARNLSIPKDHKDPEQPYERKERPPAERAADFRKRNPDVPVVEKLDSKILSAIESGTGKLDMGNWHTCGTTHCRGGWAIHLAGDAGYALEKKLGVHRAARAIYVASTGRSPHFFAKNEAALMDIKRCAEKEST